MGRNRAPKENGSFRKKRKEPLQIIDIKKEFDHKIYFYKPPKLSWLLGPVWLMSPHSNISLEGHSPSIAARELNISGCVNEFPRDYFFFHEEAPNLPMQREFNKTKPFPSIPV